MWATVFDALPLSYGGDIVIVIVIASASASASASANELGLYVVLFRIVIVLASTPFNVQLDARG